MHVCTISAELSFCFCFLFLRGDRERVGLQRGLNSAIESYINVKLRADVAVKNGFHTVVISLLLCYCWFNICVYKIIKTIRARKFIQKCLHHSSWCVYNPPICIIESHVSAARKYSWVIELLIFSFFSSFSNEESVELKFGSSAFSILQVKCSFVMVWCSVNWYLRKYWTM